MTTIRNTTLALALAAATTAALAQGALTRAQVQTGRRRRKCCRLAEVDRAATTPFTRLPGPGVQ
jgi:hypothetical protein